MESNKQIQTPKQTAPSKPKFKFPTEIVDLPSKGIVYPKSNPLSSGKVEMKYMTAKEEDIITNQAYIKKGIIVDKLLEALVVSEGVDLGDMIVGDKNKFTFQTPHSENLIEFSLMTDNLEKKVEAELRGYKKLNKEVQPEMSTRLKHMILSVDGNSDKKDIREFVDNYFLARDSKALRDYIVDIQPDVNMGFDIEKSNGDIEEIVIPIGANFFFPDA